MELEGKKLKKLFDASTVIGRVEELASSISSEFTNTEPVIIGIMNGSFIFLADLIRNLTISFILDFIKVSSYHGETHGNNPVLKEDLQTNIEKKDVLIIEDIVDTGASLNLIKRILESKKPNSIKVCTLIDKIERRKFPLKIDYFGFRIEKGFVVGYGMDYKNRGRNFKDIYTFIE